MHGSNLCRDNEMRRLRLIGFEAWGIKPFETRCQNLGQRETAFTVGLKMLGHAGPKEATNKTELLRLCTAIVDIEKRSLTQPQLSQKAQ